MDINNERGLRDLHLELVKLMKTFDEFCTKNNINYSMSGGALLGTIREKGIIPWDDDIDVQFDRSTYERIIPMLKEYPGLTIEKDMFVYRVMLNDSKIVCGAIPTIDLFVFDNVPDNHLIRLFKRYSIAFLQGMYKRRPEYAKFSLPFKVCSFISSLAGRIVPTSCIDSLYGKISQIGNSRDTEYVNCYNTFFKLLKLLYPSLILTSGYERKKFEDIEVNVTKEYDKYLTVLYGDYMTPPPAKEQIPTHQKS